MNARKLFYDRDTKTNAWDIYLAAIAVVYTICIITLGWFAASAQAAEDGGGIGLTILWFIVGVIMCAVPPIIFLTVGGWLAFFVFFRFGGYIAFVITIARYVDGMSLIENAIPMSFMALAFSILNTYATIKAEVKYFG